MLSSTLRGTLLGLVAILLWSTSVGVTRSTIESLGPTGGPAVLFTVSAALLLLRRSALREVPRRYLFSGGALFLAYQACFVLSLGLAHDRQQAIEVSMVNYLWPSLTVLVATLAAGRRPNALMLAGLALAFAGVIGASSPPEGLSQQRFFDNAAANPAAYALGFGAAIAWALYSTVTRHLAQGKSGLGCFMGFCAAVFWVAQALQSTPPAMRWDAGVVLLVVLASAAVALGYAAWDHGVSHGNLPLLGLAANATPLLSSLFASALLGATLSPAFWGGAAMVVAGSAVAGIGAAREAGAGR